MMTTVLLVPGLICDAHVWAAVLAAVPGAVVADVTAQPTIADMAADLLARHAGPLVVMGHSMGGRVAMEMARQAPDRIEGLALLNTGMSPKKDGEEIKRQTMIDLANTDGMAALARVWLPGMLASGLPPDPQVVAGLTGMVCRMTPEIHERQMRALLSRPDASRTIGAFTGPMLLLTGRQDIWSPVAQHEEIAALCPQAVLHIIDAAGHFAPVEQPQAVARVLADWVHPLLQKAA
jgi:pimeloyl-ACP methyl ester carboxylesterase